MSVPWNLRQPDPEHTRRLALGLDVPPVVAGILVDRGLEERERCERWLRASPMDLHDPGLLPDMEAATARLELALSRGERILIHGDYDVDGVTGTALLMRCLELFDGHAVWHIPNRLVDGYSFGEHSITRAREVGATLVISVDNGTSAHTVIAALADEGIDTIVTDHHEAPEGPLPAATAIVNPKLAGATYPCRELCGGAVAFKLAWGLVQRMSAGKKASPELKQFLEEATAYVAVATVCDVVPLTDENRVLARFGLKALESSTNPGLRALVEIAGLAGHPLSAEDVAFQIGPRLNASGRLGSAQRAVELLLAKHPDDARRLALELDELNKRRREIEGEVLVEARIQAAEYADPLEHPILVLAGQGWHQGVVGIVAARLVEEFDRPAVVIGLDGAEGRGSARTVDGFHVLDAIAGAQEHLARFGGHAQAAGLEIESDKVDRARAAIVQRAREMLAEGTPLAGAELSIDGELEFADMNTLTMRQLDRLAPFGAGNETPVFVSRDVRLAEDPRVVGQTGTHLLLRLRRGDHVLKAMAFGMASRIGELVKGRPLDIAYRPRWNHFRGQTNLELQLIDFRQGVPAQDLVRS